MCHPLPRHTRHVMALRSGGHQHPKAPAKPHLHPLPRPNGRLQRGSAGMALPLVSHSTPKPPSARGLESNNHSRMAIHQRAGRPRERSHRIQPLHPNSAGPHEASMRPLQQKCQTLGGNKEELQRLQILSCQGSDPKTAYLFHLMSAYITQGRPDMGLFCLTPGAQTIITRGIGAYTTRLPQPTQSTTRTAQGNPVHIYHPTAIARLPIPSDTNITFFTDASGTQQLTPMVRSAPAQVTRLRSNSTLSTLPVPPSLGPRPTANCAPCRCHQHHIATHTNPASQHLGSRRRHGRHSPYKVPHRTTPLQGARIPPHHTGIGAIDGLQRHAPPGRPAHCQAVLPPLHVQQWTHRHACQPPEHKPPPRAPSSTSRGHTTATCSSYPRYPWQHSPGNCYPKSRHTRTETHSTTAPYQSNNSPPHWAIQQRPSSYDASRTPSVSPSTTQLCAQIASQHTC